MSISSYLLPLVSPYIRPPGTLCDLLEWVFAMRHNAQLSWAVAHSVLLPPKWCNRLSMYLWS